MSRLGLHEVAKTLLLEEVQLLRGTQGIDLLDTLASMDDLAYELSRLGELED